MGGKESVISLAADVQSILGDVVTLATNMFPQKPTSAGKGEMLPNHLWPKSVKYGIFATRRRTNPSEAWPL